GAERGKLAGGIDAVDIEGDARHDESFAPPSDQLGATSDAVDIVGRGGAKADIIGAELGKQHGRVTGESAIRADIRLAAKERAGLAVSLGIGRHKMHAVGTKAFGELHVVFDEARGAGSLREVDQAIRVVLVERGPTAPERHASDVGARQSLRELRFEFGRGPAGELQVEPALRLYVSHASRLLPPSARRDNALTAPVSNHT